VRAAAIAFLVGACSSAPTDRPRTFGGDRPVDLEIPLHFDDSAHYPLVLVLHGYAVNGFVQEAYLGIRSLTAMDQAFLVAPTGFADSMNRPYWNADPACCDFDHANPDDVGYLAQLVTDIADAWPVTDIYVVGHGAGAFMAYRFACDRADLVSAIVPIAGAAALDPATCHPSAPVDVLHLHGTADVEFPFDGGGEFGMTPGSPGAVASTMQWATLDGCATTTTAGTAIDLDDVVAGAETTPAIYGCTAPPAGSSRGRPAEGAVDGQMIDVELWTMQGTEHLPGMTETFVPAVWPWLLAHHR